MNSENKISTLSTDAIPPVGLVDLADILFQLDQTAGPMGTALVAITRISHANIGKLAWAVIIFLFN